VGRLEEGYSIKKERKIGSVVKGDCHLKDVVWEKFRPRGGVYWGKKVNVLWGGGEDFSSEEKPPEERPIIREGGPILKLRGGEVFQTQHKVRGHSDVEKRVVTERDFKAGHNKYFGKKGSEKKPTGGPRKKKNDRAKGC